MSDQEGCSGPQGDEAQPKVMSAAELLRLVDDKQFGQIRKLVKHELLARAENGDTILHRVVVNSEKIECLDLDVVNPHLELARHLLATAPQLAYLTNNKGETPLCCACNNVVLGIEMIFTLVQIYPLEALSIPDKNGDTPLHHLVGLRFYKAPKTFCNMTMYPMEIYESEDDFDTLKEKLRAHFQHCLSQYELTVPLLIDKGADMDAENKEGLTPLISTLHARFTVRLPVDYDKTIELLIEKGAKLCTSKGHHAITFVKSLKFAEMILARKDCDVNQLDSRGWTPLHQIMNHATVEYIPMIKMMMEHGAVIEAGSDIITIARRLDFPFEFIEFLLSQRPHYDVNTKDHTGATLLIQYGNTVEVIDKLLALGADISIVDRKGRNAWCNAWSIEDPAAARRLIDAGVDASTEKEIISVFMGHYCRVTSARDNNCEEWFELIKYVLNLPKFQSSVTLKNILSSIKAGMLGRKGFDKARDFRVLKYIVDQNKEIITFLSDSPIYCHAASLQFQNTMLDPIGWILAFAGMLYHDNYAIDDYVMFLFKVGFEVVHTPVTQVTPLSALLTVPRGVYNCDFRALNLAKEFIKRGVNVESSALVFSSDHRDLQALKTRYLLPDALLLAFLNNRHEVVRLLLPHWWAPPLALLLFRPVYTANDFVAWFNELAQYQGIPHGTHMYMLVHDKVRTVAAQQGCHPMLLHFQDMHSAPRSLRELCKFAVRKSLAARAAHPETTLPLLLEQTVEPTLRFLVTTSCQ